jgi:hypothetical protein
MKRVELEHILRAASGITGEREFIVIGSQAILASHPDAPPELLASRDADLFHPTNAEATELVDGTIGELSAYEATFGYYAHGVAEETATLPAGWKERLVPICNENTNGATGWCLDPHDLAISKLIAAREKDIEYVQALLQHGFVQPALLRERLASTLLNDETMPLAAARLGRLIQNATPRT